MAKKRKASKKRKSRKKKGFFHYLWKFFSLVGYGAYWLVKGIVKSLIWIVKKIISLFKKSKETKEKKEVEKTRSEKGASYKEFTIIDPETGDFKKFELKIQENDSTIGIVLGARGTGKTAVSVKMLENVYARTQKKCYAIGFREEDMPIWIKVVDDIKELKNDSFVLIDEGGILFSSRKSMSKPNELLSELMLIARHKNISIIFISQNSANLEINALRQADYLILKPSSLLQKDFERKKIKTIYEKTEAGFRKNRTFKGLCYIFSDEFTGFVDNPLPSFWSKKISKAFKGED